MTTSTVREVSLTFCSTAFLAILLIGANNARILDLSACSSFAAPTPHIILTYLYLLVPRHINSLSPAFVRPALKSSVVCDGKRVSQQCKIPLSGKARVNPKPYTQWADREAHRGAMLGLRQGDLRWMPDEKCTKCLRIETLLGEVLALYCFTL